MNCEDARRLLNRHEEPAAEVLEALFTHIDGCPSCAAQDESLTPPRALGILGAAQPGLAGLYDNIRDRLEVCTDVRALLIPNTAAPSDPELELAFNHLDACASCREDFGEESTPAPLLAYTAARPSFNGFADLVMSALGSCHAAQRALRPEAAEPAALELEVTFAHLEHCAACRALEEPVPAPIQALLGTLPKAAFDDFYQQLEGRLAPSALSFASPFRVFASRRGLLALAAALLLGALLLRAINPALPPEAPRDIARQEPRPPQPISDDPSVRELLEQLRGFQPGVVPGSAWAEVQGEIRRDGESAAQEGTLPGNGAEVPGPAHRGREGPRPDSNTRPQPAAGVALSF